MRMEWHAGGSPIDNSINYCTRGMWKISCYRLKEEAVEAAVVTFPRPVSLWYKDNLSVFMSSMKNFPSVVSLQIPINKSNSVSLVCSPHFFPSHPSVSCSTLGTFSVSHRYPAMACWLVPYREPRTALWTTTFLNSTRSFSELCILEEMGRSLGVSLCVMWHETCHFAFQFLSFPDGLKE